MYCLRPFIVFFLQELHCLLQRLLLFCGAFIEKHMCTKFRLDWILYT